MSLISNLNRLPIEYITLDSTTPLLIVLVGLIQVFFSTILGWDHKIYSYFLLQPNSSESKKSFIVNDGEKTKKNQSNQQLDHVEIVSSSSSTEIEIQQQQQQGINILDLDLELVSRLFDEEVDFEEDEMKAAFDVFDENKDGFIDEFELQRVLCDLGFKQGLEIDDCKKMILLAHNNNDQSRIDFNGFVNLLTNSFLN